MNNSVSWATNAGPATTGRVAPAIAQIIRITATMIVVTVPLVVLPWGQDAYSRPKVFVLHALTAVMLLSWGVLRFIARQRWRLTRGELALWACLLAVLVSSWTTVNPRLTFFGSPARYEGLVTLGAYAALYFVGAQFFASEAGLRRLVTWAAGTGILVAVYGIVQLFVPPLFFGEAFTRNWYGGLGFLRIPSTVGGPVVLGGYLAFVLPLVLALAGMSDRGGRAIWLGGASLVILALTLTFTRGAWIASGMALAAFGLALGRAALRQHRVTLIATLLAILASWSVLATSVAGPDRVKGHIAGMIETDSGSVGSRVFIWDKTLKLIGARPMLGWGLETLREIFPYDDRQALVRAFGRRPVIVDRAHNDVLQMAVSIGIPGATAYLVFWILTVAAALAIRRRTATAHGILAAGCAAALIGYLVQAQFAFSSVAVSPIVWLLAGSVAGWESSTPRGESRC